MSKNILSYEISLYILPGSIEMTIIPEMSAIDLAVKIEEKDMRKLFRCLYQYSIHCFYHLPQ